MPLPIVQEIHQTAPPSAIYRDAEVEARAISTDALLALIEVATFDVNDPDPDWPGDVGRHMAGERLRAYEAELARRTRILALPAPAAAKAARDREAWADLARRVRELVSVPEVLALIGCPVTTAGRTRHGETEYHSPCPWCAGTDRFVSWDGPNSRGWCRQCRCSADAIILVQEHCAGCAHFRDAVRFLANLSGVTW